VCVHRALRPFSNLLHPSARPWQPRFAPGRWLTFIPCARVSPPPPPPPQTTPSYVSTASSRRPRSRGDASAVVERSGLTRLRRAGGRRKRTPAVSRARDAPPSCHIDYVVVRRKRAEEGGEARGVAPLVDCIEIERLCIAPRRRDSPKPQPHHSALALCTPQSVA
jgi:hypothetical protein